MRTVLMLVYAVLALADAPAFAADKPQEVTIPAGAYQLHGCYWTPDGPGPYPVMIFNHGSEKNPAPCGPPELVYFYQKKGFAFFTFQKQQKWTDPQRIAMMGISFGGTQTILTAEKGLGIRAFLPYAPAAQSWNPVLADRLKRAVRQASVPIFIIQAQNDYSTEPSKVLGRELEKKGAPNQAKVYPAFGTTAQEGHWGFGTRKEGIAIWAPDVSAFLDATIPR